jgi:hypothetical protein
MEHSSDSLKHKKTYSHLHESPFAARFQPSKASSPEGRKKIIPTLAHSGLREAFKKTFLPLLIDIFELRQMIDTYKIHNQSPQLRYFGKVSKTPQEILTQLQLIQQDIEESQRWCEGVIGQIAKGIKEAQEALALITPNSSFKTPLTSKPRTSLWMLLARMKRWIWKQK